MLLLEALSGLKGSWRATIQGERPAEARLRALVEHYNLTARVTFSLPVPSVDMPAFYQGLDVLVLPSRTQENWTEQFGRVLVEAMACGVPVVGSAAGEIPHVIGDAGIVFPENDVQALRAALVRLIHNQALRRDLGARGRARVLAEYTQQHVAQQTIQVYQEMLA